MAQELFYFSNEFQNLILACLLKHPEKFEAVGPIILPEYFWGLQSVQVCQALQEYCKKKGHYPSFETLSEFVYDQFARDEHDKATEAYEYVKKLEGIDTRDVDYVVEKTIRFARERALINCVMQSSVHLKEGKWPEGGFAPMFEKAMRVGENILDLGYSAIDDAEEVIDLVTNRAYGIKTGYLELDKIWFTGWGPGWLVVPLAPPKSFKSTWCLNLALNMTSALGSHTPVPVFYYACEITAELALVRAYASLTKTPVADIYRDPHKFKGILRRTLNLQMGAPLLVKFFPSKTATIADIKAHAKLAMHRFECQPKAIIIDHAETVKPTLVGKNISDWRQQADIYTEARAMGAELGCTIIMPDRCNKDTAERAVPSLTSFQGSFEKAGVVDVGIGLCQTPDERSLNQVRYFVFINRHGIQPVLMEGTVDPESMRMTIDRTVKYVPDPEDQPRPKRRRGRGDKKKPDMPQQLKDDDDDER